VSAIEDTKKANICGTRMKYTFLIQ